MTQVTDIFRVIPKFVGGSQFTIFAFPNLDGLSAASIFIPDNCYVSCIGLQFVI